MARRSAVFPPFMTLARTSIQCFANATAPASDFTSQAFGSGAADDVDSVGDGEGSNFGSGSSEHPAARTGSTTATATHRRTGVTSALFPRPVVRRRVLKRPRLNVRNNGPPRQRQRDGCGQGSAGRGRLVP
jgi:hypothetical protein